MVMMARPRCARRNWYCGPPSAADIDHMNSHSSGPGSSPRPANGRCSGFERVLGAAIRALGPAAAFDGQIHPRMRVPQVHLRHRAGQRQVVRGYLVLVLRVRLDERFGGGGHGAIIRDPSHLQSTMADIQMAVTAARSATNWSAGTTFAPPSSDIRWVRSR